MAMNLRLDPALETALRDASAQSGQSQQEITRAAIADYLRKIGQQSSSPDPHADLISSGTVRAPRLAYSVPLWRMNLPEGLTTSDLLDRDERIL